MKKALLIIGILLIVAGIVGLLLGGLFWYASGHTLDGSAGLYAAQRVRMFQAIISGILLLIVGIVLIVYSRKL